MKRLLILCVVACLAIPTFAADDDKDSTKAEDRIKAAGTVLDEIESAPDQGIPEEVLGSAQCVAVVPTMLKGGFIVGARFGRGVASCRNPKGWSAPAFFTIKGGSFGLQIGAQAVDLVMLIMNDDGMKNLLNSKFKLGADASVAAGPVGRHAAADTDWKLKAQVLELFPRPRSVRRIRVERRRDRPGQRRHPAVLHADGAFQDLADRYHPGPAECISVP